MLYFGAVPLDPRFCRTLPFLKCYILVLVGYLAPKTQEVGNVAKCEISGSYTPVLVSEGDRNFILDKFFL